MLGSTDRSPNIQYETNVTLVLRYHLTQPKYSMMWRALSYHGRERLQVCLPVAVIGQTESCVRCPEKHWVKCPPDLSINGTYFPFLWAFLSIPILTLNRSTRVALYLPAIWSGWRAKKLNCGGEFCLPDSPCCDLDLIPTR